MSNIRSDGMPVEGAEAGVLDPHSAAQDMLLSLEMHLADRLEREPEAARARRTFIQLREAWYFPACEMEDRAVDEVAITVNRGEEPGTLPGYGAFAVRWYPVGTHEIAPRLEVFHDAFPALALCPDLLAALAEHAQASTDLTRAALVQMLRRLGFADVTVRVNPNPPPSGQESEGTFD